MCILIIVLRSHVIIKALFVTQFKIYLHYDFIWWILPPVGAAIGVLGVAVEGREGGGGEGDPFYDDQSPKLFDNLHIYSIKKRKFRLCEL
jgi:hypothetical protein